MNRNIKHTVITDKIRVSSAMIFYENDPPGFGNRYQYETFIFSDDPNVRTTQIIHGSSHSNESERLVNKAIKIHDYITSNLQTYKLL